MDINSEKSKKISFFLNSISGNRKEMIVNLTDTFKSVLDNFNEYFKPTNNYNTALYYGGKIDLTKSISELEIEEGSNVVVNYFENNNTDNDNTKGKDKIKKELEIVNNRESPRSTQIGTMYHKHGVVLLFSNEDWTCQKCHLNKLKNESKYHCSLQDCNFNICKTCIENNSKYPLTDFIHKQIYLNKYSFSFHNHPLLYCRSSRHNSNLNFWSCNICRLTFTNRIWSFYCTYCDFDLCLICARKLVPSNDLLNGYGIKIDDHDHTLVYLISNKDWNCKICANQFTSNDGKFYCSICDFSLCKNCKNKINNENKNTNLNFSLRNYSDSFVNTKYHTHALIYCNTSRNDKETSWNCDICGINYGPQNWSFYCTKCDYDVCLNCYNKAKK